MRVVLFGECMIEIGVKPLQLCYGGDTLNTAIYMSRLNKNKSLEVRYATALGDDDLSEELIAQWQDEGVGTELVTRLPEKLPGIYMVHSDDKGERSFYYWRNDSAAKEYFRHGVSLLETAIIEQQVDVVYLSAISLAILMSDTDREKLYSLLDQHKKNKGKIVFDNNYRAKLWGPKQARPHYQKILALTDIALLTDEDEQAVFGDTKIGDILSRCRSYGVSETVIKRGGLPCVVEADGKVHEIPANQVEKVIDTCAAGDAFAAGYLFQRLNGSDIQLAAETGHALAGVVVQHRGAIIPISAMPSLV